MPALGSQLNVTDLRLTTNGSGVGTANADLPIRGLLYAVEWVDGDLADGVDSVISVQNGPGGAVTLLTLTNANVDTMYYPRELEQDNTGGNLATYAMPLIFGIPRCTIAAGGSVKTGGPLLYWYDMP